MQSIASLPIVGMDIAKNVFQVHGVDADGDGVFCQRGFGLDVADADALVDGGGDGVDSA